MRRACLNLFAAMAKSELAKWPTNETEALEFLREVIRRGNAYFMLWEESKEVFGDPDLPERDFLIDNIEYCEEVIERLKSAKDSLRDTKTGLYKGIIRAHRERLKELEQKAAVSEPLPTLEEVVKDADTFLPRLWEALANELNPAFGFEGEFILDKERGKDAALYALSAALKGRGRFLNSTTAKVGYLILCARYGRRPSPRVDKISKGKRDYEIFYDRFLEVVLHL